MTKIGVKPYSDPEFKKFYDSYYDVVRTPDFDDKTRLLKPKHGLKKIGQSQNRVCRFCGKNDKEVPFKEDAHIFPEAIGNKALASNYECDNCNGFFGETIEIIMQNTLVYTIVLCKYLVKEVFRIVALRFHALRELMNVISTV